MLSASAGAAAESAEGEPRPPGCAAAPAASLFRPNFGSPQLIRLLQNPIGSANAVQMDLILKASSDRSIPIFTWCPARKVPRGKPGGRAARLSSAVESPAAPPRGNSQGAYCRTTPCEPAG